MSDVNVIRSDQMQKLVRVGEVRLLVSVQPPPGRKFRTVETPIGSQTACRERVDRGRIGEMDRETRMLDVSPTYGGVALHANDAMQ